MKVLLNKHLREKWMRLKGDLNWWRNSPNIPSRRSIFPDFKSLMKKELEIILSGLLFQKQTEQSRNIFYEFYSNSSSTTRRGAGGGKKKENAVDVVLSCWRGAKSVGGARYLFSFRLVCLSPSLHEVFFRSRGKNLWDVPMGSLIYVFMFTG